MKMILILPLFFLISGCATSGYNPHYIVSDTIKEETATQQAEVSDPTSS